MTTLTGRTIAMLLLSSGMTLCACGDVIAERKVAAQLNAIAVECMRDGKTKEAILKLEEALAVDPACAEATRNLAKLLIVGGQYDRAEILLSDELKRNPGDVGCLVPLAQIYALQGKSDLCGTMLDQIGLAEDETLLPGTSLLLLKQGSTREAILAADKAIAAKPNDSVRWFNKGTMLERQAKWDAAADCYAMATKLNPGYMDAWLNLGNMREHQKQFDDMLVCYEKAYDLAPDSSFAQYNLGRSLALRGVDVDRGLRLLQAATRGHDAASDASRRLLRSLIARVEGKGGAK